jgi:hypothetical protein
LEFSTLTFSEDGTVVVLIAEASDFSALPHSALISVHGSWILHRNSSGAWKMYHNMFLFFTLIINFISYGLKKKNNPCSCFLLFLCRKEATYVKSF